MFDKRAWRVCRRDVFECPPGTWLSALARALGKLMGSHGCIWAIGPSIVLLKLLARRWLDCFGAVPAGRQFYRCDRPKVVQWFVPFAKNGLPLGFRSRSMCSMRDLPENYRPLYLQALPNLLKPLPGETVAALTRDISTSSPA